MNFVFSLLIWGGLLSLAVVLAYYTTKVTFTLLIRRFMSQMMTTPYAKNLLEAISAFKRSGIQRILELNLRAESGKVIERPLGSPKSFHGFDSLRFNLAQLYKLPTEKSSAIEMKTIIGPRSEKPLVLSMPIMISGMAYGHALSAKAKLALAKGSAQAGTALNGGAGPFLQSERDSAGLFILQYNRGFWSKDPKILQQVDAIEIQLGQGALGGLSHKIDGNEMDQKLQQAFAIPPGRDVVVKARQHGMNDPTDFSDLVSYLRALSNGVPIGVKLALGNNIEQDIALALEGSVDYIALSGAQAGTHGAPPIIGDHFGLPALFGLVRAEHFLSENNSKDKVSLIIDGGFMEPGEMLKALALGADAVYIGTAALYAISHTQVLKTLPWLPPTQLVWYQGSRKSKFKPEKGAQNLANYLTSCSMEMAEGVRALGKTNIRDLARTDLFAVDSYAAEISGLPLGYKTVKIYESQNNPTDPLENHPRCNQTIDLQPNKPLIKSQAPILTSLDSQQPNKLPLDTQLPNKQSLDSYPKIKSEIDLLKPVKSKSKPQPKPLFKASLNPLKKIKTKATPEIKTQALSDYSKFEALEKKFAYPPNYVPPATYKLTKRKRKV